MGKERTSGAPAPVQPLVWRAVGQSFFHLYVSGFRIPAVAPECDGGIPAGLVICAKPTKSEPDARQAELACTPLRSAQEQVSDPPPPILG